MISKTTSFLMTLLIAFILPLFFKSEPPMSQQIENEKACVNKKIDSFLNDTTDIVGHTNPNSEIK